MAVDLGTAVGYLELDYTKFKKALDSAVEEAQGMGGKLSATLGDGLSTVGGKITSVGKTLTTGLTVPIAGALASSVKFAAGFDKQMSAVKAVTGATGDEFTQLRDKAIELGGDTKYTATEVADAMYYMGLAGWKQGDVLAHTTDVLSLASAGNLDLARTSDIVTDAMTALQIPIGKTTEFTNVLAAAMSNSNTDVDQLGESFKYAATIAGSLSFDFRDLAVAQGLFANNGVKASQAGTGFRQALNALLNPSEKAALLMDKYGVSLDKGDGSIVSLMSTMQSLRSTFGDVNVNAGEVADIIDALNVDLETEEGQITATEAVWKQFGHDLPTTDMEKMSSLVQIFGVRALPGMLSVINASEEDFNGLVDAIYGADRAFVKTSEGILTFDEAYEKFGDRIYTDNSFEFMGAAAGMAAIMMENLSGKWDIFTSALGTAGINISDFVNGALTTLLEKGTAVLDWFNGLDKEQQESIIKFGLVVAAIGPVLAIFGSLVTGIGNAIKSVNEIKGALEKLKIGFSLLGESGGKFSGLGSVISGTSSVSVGAILGIVAVIAVLVAAFTNLWNNNEDFRNKIIGIWDGLKLKFEEAGQKIVEILNDLGFNFEDFGQVIQSIIDTATGVWNAFCETMAPVFEGAFAIISDTVGFLVDLFVGAFEMLAGLVKGFSEGDWSMFWQGLGDIVSGAVEFILNILDDAAEMIWNFLQTWVNGLGGDWTTSWDDAKKAVGDWFDSAFEKFDAFLESFDNFITGVGESVSGFVDGVKEWFAGAWQAIEDFFKGIGEWFASIPEKIGNFVTTVSEAVSGFVKGIIEWFSQLPTRIGEFFGGIWETVTTWASGMIEKAVEVGSGFIENIREFFSKSPEEIGEILGHIIGKVIKWVLDMIAKAKEVGSEFVSNIVNFFKELPGKIKDFITNAWNHIKEWSTNMIDKAKETAKTFLNNIVTFFRELPGKIKDFITSAWENVKKWATDMVNKAKEMAKQFLDNIVSFFKQLPGKIKEFITSAWENVKQWATDMVNKAKEMAKQFLDNVVTFFRELPGKIKEFITNAYNNVVKWVSDMIAKAKEMGTEFINNVKTKMAELPGEIKKKLDEGIAKAKEFVTDMANKAKEAVTEFINSFKKSAEDVPNQVKEVGENIVSGVWNGILAAKDKFFSDVKGFFSGLIKGAKDELEIESPSKVFAREVGRWIPPGILKGFEQSMPSLISGMQNELDEGVDKISDDTNALMLPVEYMGDAFMDALENMVVWYETMETRLSKAVDGLSDHLEYLMLVGNSVSAGKIDVGAVYGGNARSVTMSSQNASQEQNSGSGDTFVFYSNESIDEVKAARLLRQTKRDIAEGF